MQLTLSASLLGCKFYHVPPLYIASCNGRIYYVVHKLHYLSKTTIHFRVHNHLVVDGKCRESMGEIKRLIVEEVDRMPDAKMFAIP